MHEISVMASIIECLLKELEGRNIERVEEVNLRVGEMTFLGHEQLEFAFEIMTRNTALEGSRLRIETEEIEVLCNACGYRGGIEYAEKNGSHFILPVLHCPVCGGTVQILRGKGCTVTSIQVVES